jgi:hypothetical protein
MEVDKVDSVVWASGIAMLCFVALIYIMGNNQQDSFDIAIDEMYLDEIIITPVPENSFEVYEQLPEIVINDPVLPRALPPLIEGGEVYFEETFAFEEN